MKKFKYENLPISLQITIVAFLVFSTLAVFVILFSANQVVQSKNQVVKSISKNKSFGVIEKIDRIFFERYGDVQAFSFNKISENMISNGKANINDQQFINKMMSVYQLYDYMLIINKKGKIVAANTINKNGESINTDTLLGTPFISPVWNNLFFKQNRKLPWYSDFISFHKTTIHKNDGVEFVAPIQNSNGDNIGLWYNLASWDQITKSIIKENEENLHMSNKGAFILITNKDGIVIDASDKSLISKTKISLKAFLKGETFNFKGKNISKQDYIIGETKSRGAYTYEGNGWIALVFYPKYKMTFSIIYNELCAFTLMILLIFVGGIMTFHFLSRRISSKIIELQKCISALSEGKILQIQHCQAADEIGQMSETVGKLMERTEIIAQFAKEIGKGNFEVSYHPASNEDVLGNSLIKMKNDLQALHSLINEKNQELQLSNEEITTQNEEIKAQSESINSLNIKLEQLVVQRTEELQNTLTSLKIRNEDLEKFSYIVAHNLKGPVSSLKGLFPLYDFDDLTNENNKTVMEYTKRSINILDEVIKDLNMVFEFKNINNHNFELVNLEVELKKTFGLLEQEIETSKAQINYNFSSLTEFISYPSYIQNIFYNLISNAIKHSKKELEPVIEINSFINNNNVIITISDNGIGMNLKEIKIKNLFDMYQRYNFETEGKGIGLFLVKSQIDILNGSISIESELDKGTIMTIELPIKP